MLDGPRYGDPDTDELASRAYVMSPPLRTPADQELLWDALADGTIQFVGTDHCSFTLAGQKAAAADFAHTPNGGPGLELRMGLLYTYGVAAGRLTPERFVEVTSTNAAKYFGLYPRKGVLAPGSDADIVVYDPNGEHLVRHADLHDATDHTPYEGLPLRGRVRDVFLRGEPVAAPSPHLDVYKRQLQGHPDRAGHHPGLRPPAPDRAPAGRAGLPAARSAHRGDQRQGRGRPVPVLPGHLRDLHRGVPEPRQRRDHGAGIQRPTPDRAHRRPCLLSTSRCV